MKRNSRLGRGSDLNLLLRSGRRISHAFFSVVWRISPGPGHRLACIVPRAVDKRAVARNRLRRRISEFLRVHGRDSASPFNLDIAIICRRAAATAARRQLYAALKELLLRFQHDRR